MLRPRIEEVALVYGCHDDRWVLPDAGRPVVITGPNGSGKTTLVEGIARTLYGFDRRRPADADGYEAVRPWTREDVVGRVVLAADGDRHEIRRNFRTDEVRVVALAGGVERFRGDGNPAARNQEARRYRRLLAELFGLRRLDGYRGTLFIRQGELTDTALGEHLLRVAAGGHARVEAARREIGGAHRTVTRRPLHAGAAPAINPRELEKLEEEIGGVRGRLDAAREAAERRGPLVLDRDRTAERLAVLEREIETLEEARSAFARSQAAGLGARRLRERLADLSEAASAVHGAAEELRAARSALADAEEGGTYPDDFPERLARAELRWRDLAQLEGTPAPALPVAAGLALAAAAGLLAAGLSVPGGAALGVAGILAAAWVGLRWGLHRRRRTARADVRGALEGVPDADAVSPGTRERHLARHRAQRGARERLAVARGGLAEALRHGRSVLRASGPAEQADAGAPEPALSRASRDRRLAARLEAAAERTRLELVRDQLELDEIGDVTLDLPQDVPPTEDAVAEALRSRRRERDETRRALHELSQELLERGAPSESVASLEGLLRSLEPRREALALKADVLEAAHALITDAYAAFRDRDQERLVARVSDRIVGLTCGRIGPLVVEEDLDQARVRIGDRVVPLRSPPLSYGEYHAALLGVRLGTADYLAGIGVLPPLIIDEPFAHLDTGRARAVWSLLGRVAERRQVLVTAQDALLLDALGVEPDITLPGRRPPAD